MEKTLVDWGGIGLQVLGLGPNGHLGFNEPGTAFDAPTRMIQLTPASIQSNARYWGGDLDAVPKQGFTLGLATLRNAENTLLLVNGPAKAHILRAALYGPVTPQVPATCLRDLPNVHVIADQEAASLLDSRR